MPPKLKESDYCLSWIVMVLCYIVTTSMVGFAFGMVGLAFGFNTRNQMPLLKFITIPVLLVTTYLCFRFLAKELAHKAVERALDEKRDQERAAKKTAANTENKPSEIPPAQPTSSGAM